MAHFFMENADAMRARKYVQSHTLDTALNEGLRSSRGMMAEYDGVAEVWFESEQDFDGRHELTAGPEIRRCAAGR